MKKRVLGAIFALLMTSTAFAQESSITERQLPQAVKQSVAKYFGKQNISAIVKDIDFSKTTYEVFFANGSKAEFRSNGELKDAENHSGLSSAVVPAKIQAYVKRNYPNTLITKWEKSRYKQEIQLNNGIDLEFDLSGRFLRID